MRPQTKTLTVSQKQEIQSIHRAIAKENDTRRRFCLIAQRFLGRSYLANPLGGGLGQPEKLEVNLKGFDCVTLVETSLALARSRSIKGFLHELRHLRYRNGHIAWSHRLHYFYDWLVHNQKRGAVRIRSRGEGSRPVTVTLKLLKGFSPRRARFHVVPKMALKCALPRILDGTIVAFASTRAGLDFFHVGILAWSQRKGQKSYLTMTHAPRSIGKVFQEPLDCFLGRNRTRGIAFAEINSKGGRR